MTKRMMAWVIAIAIAVALAISVRLSAQEQREGTSQTGAGTAEQFHYRYVSLSNEALGITSAFFDFRAIDNGGRVYGTLFTFTDVSVTLEVAVVADQKLTVLQPGVAVSVNNGGTIGGAAFIDPAQTIEQAALFRKDHLTLLPPQPGELQSYVSGITDSGIALVDSTDATTFQTTFVLFKNGQEMPLDLGLGLFIGPFVNNNGTVAGTANVAPPIVGTWRAFRFSPDTGVATLLDPLPTEPSSWGLGINSRGDVLGLWDKDGTFHTYFVEGTKEVPTVSNSLLFNQSNTIVITAANDSNSYLVPKPGSRLNLADITENLPAGVVAPLERIIGINDHGDMIGFNYAGTSVFLLKRIGNPN